MFETRTRSVGEVSADERPCRQRAPPRAGVRMATDSVNTRDADGLCHRPVRPRRAAFIDLRSDHMRVFEELSAARPAEIGHTPCEVRRMTTEGQKQLGEDHEVWLKCFVATLSGATRTVTESRGPEDVASICAAIADAALKEERQRRPDVKWPR